MIRSRVEMTKPSIVGVSILDISKCLMYEFHYEFMLEHFKKENNQCCKLLYTDTDSFLYELSGQDADPYEFMRKHSNEFDTSDFAKNNIYGIRPMNNKELGMMKDENSGEVIEEVICLRSKMYIIIFANSDKVVKRAKGVKKYVLDKKITFDDFKRCITTRSPMEESQNCMRSLKHDVFNTTNMKKVLDFFDDKRYLKRDGGHSTLPWGHYSIR